MEEIKGSFCFGQRDKPGGDGGRNPALPAGGADFSVEARGLLVQFPEPLNQKAEAVMISNGIVWENFSSRQLEESDFEDGTMVLP